MVEVVDRGAAPGAADWHVVPCHPGPLCRPAGTTGNRKASSSFARVVARPHATEAPAQVRGEEPAPPKGGGVSCAEPPASGALNVDLPISKQHATQHARTVPEQVNFLAMPI